MSTRTVFTLCFTSLFFSLLAQSPVGNWKVLSHISVFQGTKMDSQEALLSIRPCAAKIVYVIEESGVFRLDASKSGCDEKYKSIQEKLYSKTKWKVENGIITTSATNFAVGQSYKLSFKGDKMIWVGTDDQGTIEYQRM